MNEGRHVSNDEDTLSLNLVSPPGASDPSTTTENRTSDPRQQRCSVVPYSIRYWDVKVGHATKQSVRGLKVPTLRGALSKVIKKRRRIRIEIHKALSSSSFMTDEQIKERATPVRGFLFSQGLLGISGEDESLGADDFSIV